MDQYTSGKQANAPMSTVGQVLADRARGEHGAYIGLDVHKETIAVSVARPGRAAAEDWGEIRHTAKAIGKLVERLNAAFGGEPLLFCYEAGPCGYGLHRRLLGLGHDCQVVAPSLIPTRPGDRIKTDRRDARRQGGITGTGNRRGRRILVESAWSYRFTARQTAHLARKAAGAPPEAQRIAWTAQKRLCGRYRTLLQSGKNTKQTTVAIARELAGFVWAIAHQSMPPANVPAA